MVQQSFAYGLNFYKLFWIFFIACFLGVVVETLWCKFRFKKFESRKGLVYGPFNLVYGFGAVVMTVVFIPLSDARDFTIIVLGALIGGIYEYVCSAFQERVLGSVPWNYSDFQFNLNGRINLLYCLLWGFLALFWSKLFYPYLSQFIELIPSGIGISLTWVCLIFIIADSIISAFVVYRMNERLKNIQRTDKLSRFIDKHFPNEKVQKLFPTMEFRPVK